MVSFGVYGQRGGLTDLGVLRAMDINSQFDQELLSAYLDDALTAAELSQVEQWLASDLAAATYLDQLRSNRNTLKAIADLPTVGLKASLAARVLEKALAAQAENVASEPVRLPSNSSSSQGRSWLAWGTLAATAAAIGWFAIVPLFRQPQINTLLPDVVVVPEVPQADPKAPEDVPDASEKRPEEFVGTGPTGPDLRHDPVDVIPLHLLFIGDVVMTESAWDAGKFDALLESYGIRFEKEIVASKQMLEGLIDSQTIVGPDADPQSQQEAALIYIDCPAVALSKLIVKLESDGKDFLGFNFNMAMSGGVPGVPNSYDKLMKSLAQQAGTSPGRGTARLIVPKPSDALGKILPQFEAVKKKTSQPMLMEAAALVEAGIQSQGNLSVENQTGQLLLILRKQ